MPTKIVPKTTSPLAPELVPAQEPTSISLPKHQVEGDAVESCISDKHIGARIKALRLKKSMGLVELGQHTGLSASFLSQLETGRVVPTLRNLARISMVFSKDLNYFFEPEAQSICSVHRAKDRLRLPQSGVAEPMYFFESLAYQVPGRDLDPYLAEFLPLQGGNGTTGMVPRPHQHTGCEFLYVVTGELTLCHGESVHVLGPGDSVYFDSSTTHSYCCSGETPATVLIVTHQQAIARAAADTRPHRPAARELYGTDLTLLGRKTRRA